MTPVCTPSPKPRRQKRQVRDAAGRFVQTWHLEESPSEGGPAERRFLPPPVGPWKFRWYRKCGRKRLYIECERDGSLGGKRVRLLASSPAAALEKVRKQEAEILEHGKYARALTTEQRVQMSHMLTLCEPLGISPLEIVQDYVRKHPLGGAARTLDQVRLELIERKTKGRRRPRYVRDFDYKQRKLIEGIGNLRVTDVTTDHLEAELERHPQWGARTVHSQVQSWHVVFAYCVKRGYRTDNPCDKLELPVIDQKEPVIFTLAQIRKLLGEARCREDEAKWRSAQLYLALGLFAGIRPEELDRLTWNQIQLYTAPVTMQTGNISWGSITIPGDKAKCRDRRIVDVSYNLFTWLKPWVRKRGAVLEYPVDTVRPMCRRVLGLKRWPHDVSRHCFGSYHFAFHRHEAFVKNQMGHKDDGRLFFSHYRALVEPALGVAFWAIVRPVALLTYPLAA